MYVEDGSRHRLLPAVAAPFPTALLVERRCSMTHGSRRQVGRTEGKGQSSLREVLIRIPAETEGGRLLSPSSSSSPSPGGGCSPSPGKKKAPFRRKRPWPWSNNIDGGGSPSSTRKQTVTTSEGSSHYDGPVNGDKKSGGGGGGSGEPVRISAGAEDRRPVRDGGAHRRQTIGSLLGGDADGVALVDRDASTDEVIARKEGGNRPFETDGSSSGPIRAGGASDTPPPTGEEEEEEEEEESSTLHWPIRDHEAIKNIGERKSPQRLRGEARDEEEASDGRGGIKKRRNGQSRHHGNGEEGVVTRGTRQQQQTVRVVVHEVLSEDFGLFTWPSGVVLACLVWARRREFRGASVVEIGAGTALPGLLAAKLGATVALTDREGAPWVLENIRGAVAANGLNPDDTTLAAASAGGASAADVGAGIIADPRGGGDAANTTEGQRVEGCGSKGEGNGEGRREEARGHTRELPKGKCSVHELSWGSVGPASMKLAREQWCPQVVLGADVFYSSEHFDSVLATAYMLLSASSAVPYTSGGDGGGCGSAGVNTADATSSPVRRDVGGGNSAAATGIYSAGGGGGGGAAATTADHATTSTVTTPAASAEPTDVADTTSLGSPLGRTKCVFLTAYQERSSRRSLRPLLRKWGMGARVLHGAPQQVLPPALWESGRYDSVALLEITLLQ